MTNAALVGGIHTDLAPLRAPWLAPIAQIEVLGFDARLWVELPAQATLVAAIEGSDVRMVVSTSERLLRAAKRQRGVVGFSGAEWISLIQAAESDRAARASLRRWAMFKAARPWWELKLKDALDGLVSPDKSRGWSVGQVLRAWGLRLDKVSSGDEVPA